MDSDNCIILNKEELKTLAEKWMPKGDTATDKWRMSIIQHFVPNEGVDGVMNLIGEILKTKNLDTSISIAKLDDVITKYMKQVDEENQQKKSGMKGRIVISSQTVDIPEITHMMERSVSFQQHNMTALASVVEAGIRERLDNDTETYESQGWGKTVEAIRRGSFNGTMSDLYALCVLAGRTVNGKPLLDVKTIKDALKGDTNALNAVRRRYPAYEKSNPNVTTTERKVMAAIVEVYARNDAGFKTYFNTLDAAKIKASNGSSKSFKVLSSVLRSMRMAETVNKDKTEWVNMSVSTLRDNVPVELIASAVNTALEKAGKRQYLLLADKLKATLFPQYTGNPVLDRDIRHELGKPVSIVEIIESIAKFIEENPDPRLTRDVDLKYYERESGDDTVYNGIDEQTKGEILLAVVKHLERVDPYSLGDLYEIYAKADGREFESRRPWLIPTAEYLRDRALAMEASVNEAAAEEDLTNSSDDMDDWRERQHFNRLSVRSCDIIYTDEQLSAHVTALATSILRVAEGMRYEMMGNINTTIQDLEKTRERAKRIIGGLEAKSNPSEADEQDIEKARKTIANCDRIIAAKQDDIEALHDEYKWRQRVFKLCIRDFKKPSAGAKHKKSIIDYGYDEFDRNLQFGGHGFNREERAKAYSVRGDLIYRALRELERISGIRVTLNRDNLYEVADVEEDDRENTEAENAAGQEADTEFSGDKATVDRIGDEVDPHAHLTANIKSLLALIPVLDSNGEQMRHSEFGHLLYYDRDMIYDKLLEWSDEITSPDDVYRILAPGEIPDTERKYPGLLRENGSRRTKETIFHGSMNYQAIREKHLRTAKEAFPDGMPTFPFLERHRGEPWVDGLMVRLSEAWMRKSDIDFFNATNPRNRDMVLSDFSNAMNFVYEPRAVMKTVNKGNHANHFFLINLLPEESNAQSVHKRKLAERGSKFTKQEIDDVLKNFRSTPPSSIVMQTDAQIENYVNSLCDTLAFLRLTDRFITEDRNRTAEYIKNSIKYADNDSLRNLDKLVRATYQMLLSLQNPASNMSQDDMMMDRGRLWKMMYQSVAPFMGETMMETTSKENGKTRQNFRTKNTFTNRLTTVTYNARRMDGANAKQREEMLAERQRRIDEVFREQLWDENLGRYKNETLQMLYEGKDIVDDFTKHRAGVRLVGGDTVIGSYDDKEKRDLNGEEILNMMVSAFLEHKANGRDDMGAPYAFPFADTPDFHFITGTIQSEQDNVAVMARFVEEDYSRILDHEIQRENYRFIYAVSRGLVYSHSYYDIIENRHRKYEELSEDDKSLLERWKTVSKYAEAVKSNDQAAIDKLLKKSKMSEDALQSLLPRYDAYRNHQYRSSFFTSEMRFGWLPALNTMRMSLSEFADKYAELRASRERAKLAAGGIKGEELEEAVEQAREGARTHVENTLFLEAPAAGTLRTMLDNVADEGDMRDVIAVFIGQAMNEGYRNWLEEEKLLEPMHLHREQANLARIEAMLNGKPDYDGVMWEFSNEERLVTDDEGNLVPGSYLVDVSDPNRRVLLSDKEVEYRDKRKAGEIKDYDTFKGENGSYKVSTLQEYRVPFAQHGFMLQMMRGMDRHAEFNDVHDVVRDIWFNMTRHNMEMMEIMGMNPGLFKDKNDATHRMKGLFARGTAMDTSSASGHRRSYYIIEADDEMTVSRTFADTVAMFAKKAAEGSMSREEAVRSALQYAQMNPTNAQGEITLDEYEAMGAMGGSPYLDQYKQRTIDDIRNGKRDDSKNNPDHNLDTLKPVAFFYRKDTDPEGNVTWVPVYLKNSEVAMIAGEHESASGQAAREFMEETAFTVRGEDGSEQVVHIGKRQRPSGEKTAKKGIVDTRFVRERVEALRDLVVEASALASEKERETLFENFAAEWADEFNNEAMGFTLTPQLVRVFYNFLDKATRAYTRRPGAKALLETRQAMTFDDIDGFIHSGSAGAFGGWNLNSRTTFDGLEQLAQKAIMGEMDEETMRNMVEPLVALRFFMKPINKTRRTVEALKGQIREVTVREDGSMNDQFVFEQDNALTYFQVRQSPHYFEEESNLGSQLSFIIPEHIDMGANYEVNVNGETVTMGGEEMLQKYYQCLAVRLMHGANEVADLFGGSLEQMKKLQNKMMRIMQGNPKFPADLIQALQIVKMNGGEYDGQYRFSTPFGSIAVLPKISDVLTSFTRNATHRRKMNGGTAVLQADDNHNLRVHWSGGKVVGVDCMLPAWSKPIMEKALVEKTINGEKVKVLDFTKLSEGERNMIGYRIPTEGMHSIIPLVVKGFMDRSRGGAIIVSGEITVMAGSDNDVDKLFMMVKHMNEQMEAVAYDLEQALDEQTDEQVENLLMDIIQAVIKSDTGTESLMIPQNPEAFKAYAKDIAYAKLPNDKKLRRRIRYPGMKEDDHEIEGAVYEYSPDDPDWDNPAYFQFPRSVEGMLEFEKRIPAEVKKKHLENVNSASMTSPASVTRFNKQYATSDTGVAIGADRLSLTMKTIAAQKLVKGYDSEAEVEGIDIKPVGHDADGLTLNGKKLTYCPGVDVTGRRVRDNMGDFAGTMIDSYKNDDALNMGLDTNAASFLSFILAHGVDIKTASYMIALFTKHNNFAGRFNTIEKQLCKEGGVYEPNDGFNAATTEDFEKALYYDGLLTYGVLASSENTGLLDACYLLSRFYSLYRNPAARLWTQSLKENSTKHGLSNEPSSATLSEVRADRVIEALKGGKIPYDISEDYVLHNGLTDENIMEGSLETEDNDGNAVETKIGMPLAQMYHTYGIESFNKAVKNYLFYGSPYYKQLLTHPVFAAIAEQMSKKEQQRFARRLHDAVSTYFISDMDMIMHRRDAEGDIIEETMEERRKYYRHDFPREWRRRTAWMRSWIDGYAIVKVIERDRNTGKLVFKDEMNIESNAMKVRASLIRMATSPNPEHRRLAMDLFLYSFFVDGLRFGKGSVSEAFSAAFLATPAFREYNDKMYEMVNREFTPDEMKEISLQFVRNNYVNYQIGYLFRMKPVTVLNQGELSLQPEPDELTQHEVIRLEQWLHDKKHGNKLYFDDAIEDDNAPRALVSKVNRNQPGTFFRVQVTYDLYDQNLYMIDQDENGMFITKVQDMTGTPWYAKGVSLEEMATLDCTGGTLLHPGQSAYRGGDFIAEQRSMRYKTMNLIPRFQPRMTELSVDELDFIDEDDTEDINFIDEGAAEEMQFVDELADGQEAQQEAEDNFYHFPLSTRRKNKTVLARVSDFDSFEEMDGIRMNQALDDEEVGDMNAGQATRSKEQVLEDHNAANGFGNKRDAFAAAFRINTSATGYIANVVKRGEKHYITLSEQSDTEAAELWRNDYGVMVMTGQQGINSVMNDVGNTQVAFVEDDGSTIDEYNDEVDDLVKMLRAASGNNPFPKIGRKTAADLIRKFYKTKPRQVRLAEEFAHAMLNGVTSRDGFWSMSGMEFAKNIMPDKSEAEITEMLERLETGDEQLFDEVMQEALTSVLMNRDTVLRATTPNNNTNKLQRYGDLFNDIMMYQMSSELGSIAGKVHDLEEVKRMASPEYRPGVSAEQQQQAEQNRRSAEANMKKAERLVKILKDALEAEDKKFRMAVEKHNKQKIDETSARIRILEGILAEEPNKVSIKDLMNYLNAVAQEYDHWTDFVYRLETGTLEIGPERTLNRMADMIDILRSHEELLDAVSSLLRSGEFAEAMDSMSVAPGVTSSLNELVNTVAAMHDKMKNTIADKAGDEFLLFVEEFVGEIPGARSNGHAMTWEQLLETYDGDITMFDQYLRSLGDTDNRLAQIFDRVMKRAKDQARETAINDQQGDIKAFFDLCRSLKIADFEFAFEHDAEGHKTGYYLTQYNNGAFQKALKEQQDKLQEAEKKYKAGEITIDELSTARSLFLQWTQANSKHDTETHTYKPSGTQWRNPEYDRLQREKPDKFRVLKKFMELKHQYDLRLGTLTAQERCIQRRMTSEQRFRANFTMSPRAFFENMKRSLAADYLVREDDYMEAGERSTILDYDNQERLITPAPFVRMLSNPDELSTDLVGCLAAYSYATANYEEMRRVTNPLEVAFDALVQNKVQHDIRGGRTMTERYHSGRKSKAVVRESRLLSKIRSAMDTQLYMRYCQDENDILRLFGRDFRKSKALIAFMRLSAKAQLGFKWLIDLANLMNGLLQTNIEVAAAKYFSRTDLLKADGIYWAELEDFIPDLSNPIKTSKLALISHALDISQTFDVRLYNNMRSDIVSKLFNSQVAFLGTTCGNHWLYHRTAIAYMLHTKVLLPDGNGGTRTTNLWEAFEVVDTEQGGKRVKLPEGATLEDGTPITAKTLHEIGRRIAAINQKLFGIYNRDDMNMAQKISWMRLLQSFRKHIVVLMDKRFRAEHVNEFGETEKGFYRSLGSFLQALYESRFKVMATYQDLDQLDKENVRRALMDISQFAALCLLAALMGLGGDDDDDETRLKKVCKYLLARERHEIGSMIPGTLYGPKEALNILQQPFMGTSELENTYNFCATALQPWTWDERVKAGPFQGQTQIEMRTRKLPIPVLSYYRNIDKSLNGIDNSTWFYSRGYVEHGGMRGK